MSLLLFVLQLDTSASGKLWFTLFLAYLFAEADIWRAAGGCDMQVAALGQLDKPGSNPACSSLDQYPLTCLEGALLQRLHNVIHGKKKKEFASFCQPARPITCASHGNHVQIFMNSGQSTT